MTQTFRKATLAMALSGLAFLAAAPAFAASTVQVQLWDKGDNSLDGLGTTPPMGMAMAGAADHGMAMVGVKTDVTEVPAGEVTFEVTNASQGMVHEMILSPVRDLTRPLPYQTDMNQVDEDAAIHLGEVSELDPGATGALTVTLKPGNYILFCNIPGHYEMGMWTTIRVTGPKVTG